MRRRWALALLWAWIAPARGLEGEVLRAAVSPTWAMPFAQYQKGQLTGGIALDLLQAIARRARLPLQVILVPESRSDYSSVDAAIDLRCHLSPSWTRYPEKYHWSEPLFDISEVLVGRVGSPPLQSVEQLKPGQRVGTVRGYTYPMLTGLFAHGDLHRDDAPDMGSALRKLAAGRTDYAVASLQSLNWHLREHGPAGLADWQLLVERTAYYCAVPKSSPLDPARVLKAASALRDSPELKALLARYRPVEQAR